MNKVIYTIQSSRQLAGDIFEVILEGDTSAITMPGQFVNLDLPGFFLRRPSPSATGTKRPSSSW